MTSIECDLSQEDDKLRDHLIFNIYIFSQTGYGVVFLCKKLIRKPFSKIRVYLGQPEIVRVNLKLRWLGEFWLLQPSTIIGYRDA